MFVPIALVAWSSVISQSRVHILVVLVQVVGGAAGVQTITLRCKVFWVVKILPSDMSFLPIVTYAAAGFLALKVVGHS